MSAGKAFLDVYFMKTDVIFISREIITTDNNKSPEIIYVIINQIVTAGIFV